jgi:hypothetical protein
MVSGLSLVALSNGWLAWPKVKNIGAGLLALNIHLGSEERALLAGVCSLGHNYKCEGVFVDNTAAFTC